MRKKTGSTHWIRKENIFPEWPGWQDGYTALTLANKDKDGVIEYIKNQDEHHRRTTFLEEYRGLLEEGGREIRSEVYGVSANTTAMFSREKSR